MPRNSVTPEAAILQRVEDNFSATPIAWPEAQFSPPSGPWIRPTVLWGDSFPLTMKDTQRNQITGVLQIDGFDLPAAGAGTIKGHLDTLADLFNRALVSGLRFGAASGPRRAQNDEGRWQQHVISVPFTVEETV